MIVEKEIWRELPKSWIISKVDDLGELIRGISYKKEDASKSQSQGCKPILRANNINGHLNFDELVYVPAKIIREEQYIKKSDLIFAMSSGSKHLVGKSAPALNDYDGSYGAFCALLRPSKYIDQSYFAYFFQGNTFRKLVSEIAKGTNINNLKREHILNIDFPLSPLPEQNQIVAKIEELFSELDNGIENLEKAREQLKTYHQAVLKYAFEGKLTKEWRTLQRRAGNPPEPAEKLLEQIKTERKKYYQKQLEDWKRACEQAKTEGKKNPAKPKKPKELLPFTDEELKGLPKLPEGWGWVKLGCVVRKIFDGPFGSNLKTKDYVEEGVRVIRLENIGVLDFINERKSCISEEKYNLIKKHKVFHGDIIFSSFISEQIRVIVLPSYIKKAINKADCFCIRVTKSSLCNKYLTFYLSTRSTYNQLIHQVHGATRPRINTTQLRNCCIPLCSNHEQHTITSEIESRLSVCDKIEQTIEDSLKKAEALRQSILKKAFSGELTKDWRKKYPELISGENSAEKLLEKIRTEKARTDTSRGKPRSKKMKK